MIQRGKALYWGTSEWSAGEIAAAWQACDRHHLHKPVVEQPQYNLFHRHRVEIEYARLYEDYGLGLTTWSPLASGLLTGKYRFGVPKDSRGALPRMGFLLASLTDKEKNAVVAELELIAKELGCSLAQLSLAWCAKNPRVSSVITGASKVEQVKENMKALEVIPKLTPAVMERIDALVANKETP
jgi:aryl-alcohol dehydrogenase-like predicted oxidoreductase